MIEPGQKSSGAGMELVIGLVAPIGANLDLVCHALNDALNAVGYDAGDEPIRLSSLMTDVSKLALPDLTGAPLDRRYEVLMEAGTSLRERLERGDAVAMLAVNAIRAIRSQQGSAEEPIQRRAFLLRSLKHPEEVRTLRRIYGRAFLLVAAYCPREERVQDLSRKIAESRFGFQSQDFRAEAEQIVKTDEAELGRPLGQNVRKVFPEADVFLDASDPERLRLSVNRFVALLFGDTFQTPSRDEYGMFLASAVALRSASLQRQVGAAITTADGDVISVGTNEVPRAGGGLYWAGDQPDRRDFVYDYEVNDRMKRRMIADLLERLRANNWLRKDGSIDSLLAEALDAGDGFLRNARAMDVIEYGRCVHAEMAAIVDAARRGVRIDHGTLYTTTFPCHECAKHIVAGGIGRVVYIEPYPKSLAPELYPDSIIVEAAGCRDQRVAFEPFVGIGPRRYMDLFAMLPRKDERGFRVTLDRTTARPRLGLDEAAELATLLKLTMETDEIRRFKECVDRWERDEQVAP